MPTEAERIQKHNDAVRTAILNAQKAGTFVVLYAGRGTKVHAGTQTVKGWGGFIHPRSFCQPTTPDHQPERCRDVQAVPGRDREARPLMPTTTVYEVTCSGCETETTVAMTYWPATRWDPPDGETSPEECPKCGRPFDDSDSWSESEPPEPERDYFEERGRFEPWA